MNFQDISDFIDLVKHPEKYEQAIKNIRDEQTQLTKVIETVGKVSEIDKIKKNLEVKVKVLEEQHQARTTELETKHAQELNVIEQTKQHLVESQAKATAAFQEAVAKETAANELAKSFAGRDKQLTKKEEEIEALRSELAARVADYNDRIEKLKSVMV